MVRAAARVYIILLVPLFYGPYYAQVRQESASFAFALFFAMILSPCDLESMPFDAINAVILSLVKLASA